MRTPLTRPEFRAWTMSDGYAVRGRLWPPRRSDPTLGIVYLHGIQSHGGWFEWSASVLAQSGQPVLLPDRRGSGRNEQARGDTPSMERWLADIDDQSRWLAAEYGVDRLALVGVSWGGKPAVAWALRNPERVERLLLIAPGLFPAVGLDLGRKIGVGASLLTNPRRTYKIPLDDSSLFTANPTGRRFIDEDPLKLSRATARFLYASARLDRTLTRARPNSLCPPVTLALAERDRIIRNAPTSKWLRRIVHCAFDERLFKGAEHTLEFEPDTGRFVELLTTWVQTPGV